MDEPAKRALHGLSENVVLAVDASEYSPELSARLVQPIADTAENLTAWRIAARRNAYHPVPESRAVPAFERFLDRCRGATEDDVRSWRLDYPAATDTALLCGAICADEDGFVPIDFDVDDQDLCNSVAFGLGHNAPGLPTTLVRLSNKGRILLGYRSRGPFKSRGTGAFYYDHQIDADGGIKSGEKATAVEILGNGKKITVDGHHRTTGVPYRWPSKSPADTPLNDLPKINGELHLTAFLDATEATFRRAGLRTVAEWREIRAGRVPGPVRTHASRAAESALRAAEKAAGVERGRFETLTETQVRALLAYVPGDLDYGDWIRVALAVKAVLDDDGEDAFLDWSAGSSKDAPDYSLRTWQTLPEPRDITAGTLFHYAEGFPGFADVRSIAAVEPTFPDRDVSIEAAEVAVEAGVELAFARAEARIAERAQIVAEMKAGARREKETGESFMGRSLSDLSKAPVVGLPVGTGIGKTRAALRRIATFVRAGRRVMFAVPQHKLSAQVAKDLRDLGVDARVWYGRKARNEAGKEMCLDHDAVDAATAAGVPVQESACYAKVRDPETGKETEFSCPHRAAGACLYQRQIKAEPAVWIVAHAMLTQASEAIGEIDLVVIDEGFWQSFVAGPGALAVEEIPAKLTAADRAALRENLDKAAPIDEGDPLATLDDRVESAVRTIEWRRERLAEMIAAHLAAVAERETGRDAPAVETVGLRREIVSEHFTVENLDRAERDEWLLKPKRSPLRPGMTIEARKKAMPRAEGARFAMRRASIWAQLEAFLRDEGADVAGRIDVHREKDDKGLRTVVRTWSLLKIAKAWRRPTVLLDATMPGPRILGPIFPADTYREVEVLPRVSARMPESVRLRQVIRAPVSERKMTPGRGKDANRNMEALRRFALAEFVAGGRGSTLIAAQMGYEAWLKDRLPEGAPIKTEHFNNVTGINDHEKVRTLVSIGRVLPPTVAVERLAGVLTGRAVEPASYARVERGIRLRDGTGRGVTVWEHPDRLCEEIRRNICDGETEQMIGRARAVRRGPGEPVEIVVLADLVIDASFDEVEVWRAPSDEVEMLVEGVVLMNASDRARAYPEIWATAKAAERSIQRGKERGGRSHPKSYIDPYIGKGVSPLLPIRYKRAGAGQKWWEAAYDPSAVPDPRAWLETRIGPLAGFEVVAEA